MCAIVTGDGDQLGAGAPDGGAQPEIRPVASVQGRAAAPVRQRQCTTSLETVHEESGRKCRTCIAGRGASAQPSLVCNDRWQDAGPQGSAVLSSPEVDSRLAKPNAVGTDLWCLELGRNDVF